MTSAPSPRRTELVDAAYGYALDHGLAGASLRPVAEGIGSSTGVLRYLFGSKDGLIRAILARAREDELDLVRSVTHDSLGATAMLVWRWLSDPGHRALLCLWAESYALSLQDPDGPWGEFAAATVTDWLTVLGLAQPPDIRRTAAGRARRTAVLALLRGAMLDLLATGDAARTNRAVRTGLAAFD